MGAVAHDPVAYAKSGDVHIAYQVSGRGQRDILLLPDGFIPIEAMTEEPSFERFLDRLASIGRLIRFDRRGIGFSDPISAGAPPTLEQWMEDGRAVLEAAGSSTAGVVAIAEGSLLGALLAATHPDHVSALVLVNATSSILCEELDQDDPAVRAYTNPAIDRWGGNIDEEVDIIAPSAAGDPAFTAWLARAFRRAASPSSARVLFDATARIDVGPVLASVHVPTLVIHRESDRWFVPSRGRSLAARIPGARYVEVSGGDHVPYLGDAEAILGEIEEFLTGERRGPEIDRVLATVLFTDIVSSTEQAVRLGDRSWRALLDRHDAMIRRQLERYRGREVKTTGDGFVAAFDGPARAIRCACAARDGARQLGIEIRAGLHTGEIEVRGDDIGGIAVNVGQRVQACAGPGEVLASSTVKDLVAGSGIAFEDRGRHALKGVPGKWRLYVVIT